jgi:hypothetical protein
VGSGGEEGEGGEGGAPNAAELAKYLALQDSAVAREVQGVGCRVEGLGFRLSVGLSICL